LAQKCKNIQAYSESLQNQNNLKARKKCLCWKRLEDGYFCKKTYYRL